MLTGVPRGGWWAGTFTIGVERKFLCPYLVFVCGWNVGEALMRVLLFLFANLTLFSTYSSRGFSASSSLGLTFSCSALHVSAILTNVNASACRLGICGHGGRSLIVSSVALTSTTGSNFHVGMSKTGNGRFSSIRLQNGSDLLVFMRTALTPRSHSIPFFGGSSVIFVAGNG